MPKSSQEIIDLCSDDEAPKSSASLPQTSCGQTCCGNVACGREHAISNPYRKRKKTNGANLVVVSSVSTIDRCCSGRSVDANARNKNFNVPSPLIFLDGEHGTDNGIVTDGLMALLHDIPNTVVCAGLAGHHSTMQHIQQPDKWSCGFRNLQILLTAVIPLLPSTHSYYQQQNRTIDDGYVVIPSLTQLQTALEHSWVAGFDPKGAAHYRHKLVGSSKFIGAVEVSNCLTFSGIENVVVQFIECIESRSLLAPFCAAYFSKQHCDDAYASSVSKQGGRASAQRLLRIIATDSCNSRPSSPSSCPYPSFPIYLQWEGHSVSVVGVEAAPGGRVENLLVFDPSRKGATLKKTLMKRNLKPLRLPVSKLGTTDCQIVLASTRSLSVEDRARLKIEVNSVTAAPDAVAKAHLHGRRYKTEHEIVDYSASDELLTKHFKI